MTLWELNLLCWQWELRLLPLVAVAWFVLFAIKCRWPEREYEEAMSRNIEFKPTGWITSVPNGIMPPFSVRDLGLPLVASSEGWHIVTEERPRVVQRPTQTRS